MTSWRNRTQRTFLGKFHDGGLQAERSIARARADHGSGTTTHRPELRGRGAQDARESKALSDGKGDSGDRDRRENHRRTETRRPGHQGLRREETPEVEAGGRGSKKFNCSRGQGEDRDRHPGNRDRDEGAEHDPRPADRKSTRLNSSHVRISYAVFCLKKKNSTTAGSTLHQTAPHTTTKSDELAA